MLEPLQPVLETERLILRPFTLDDAPIVKKYASAAEIADVTLLIPHPYEDGMAEAWIATHAGGFADRTNITYAITAKGSAEAIGAIGMVVNNNHRRAEIGYWLGVPFWGRGYMTEAASAIIRYGFDVLGLNNVNSNHFSRNPASGRVMQKIGMKHEGTLRQYVVKNGTFEDLEHYSILLNEWRSI